MTFFLLKNNRSAINEFHPTVNPTHHEIMKHSEEFVSLEGSNDRVKLTLAKKRSRIADQDGIEMIREHLRSLFIDCPAIQETLKNPLPTNLIAVSISEHNFKVGERPNEFIHLEKGAAIQKEWFYHKTDESIEITYYKENNVDYHAGLCYYLTIDDDLIRHPEVDRDLLIKAHRLVVQFPLTHRMSTLLYLKSKLYNRFCKSAGRRVTVMNSERRGIIHYEFEQDILEYVPSKCRECEKDFVNYTFKTPKGLSNAMTESKKIAVTKPKEVKNKFEQTCFRLKEKLVSITSF